MSGIVWRIPPSTRRWLAEVPPDAPVAVLLRHSVRGDLPPGAAGYDIPITSDGARLAHHLGTLLGGRLRTLHASPLRRCVQTAEAVRSGAAADIPIVQDRLLGDPGVYVVDDSRAQSVWDELGHEAVMQHLVTGDSVLSGMADPVPAARRLVQHVLAVAGNRSGLHVFVSHDSVVTATAARLLGEPLGMDDWPWYLEGAFFWRKGERVLTAYRDRFRQRDLLVTFDERDVVDFARREVAMAVGLACEARFFLAGGAFKTLLTGRPPRDLDLWAPSERDRQALLAALAARGARPLAGRPFADAFEIGGRTIELVHKIGPNTLMERLSCSDIALAAVGAEHLPGDQWRAIIHPLALTSIELGHILLLKPLVNREYALVTLERMRRYADELGYAVPADEETAVWSVFDSQPDGVKRTMLERFEQTAIGGYGVREEALCRLQ